MLDWYDYDKKNKQGEHVKTIRCPRFTEFNALAEDFLELYGSEENTLTCLNAHHQRIWTTQSNPTKAPRVAPSGLKKQIEEKLAAAERGELDLDAIKAAIEVLGIEL